MRDDDTIAENPAENGANSHPPGIRRGSLVRDDEVVVYDIENPDAWIRSDRSVAPSEVR